MFVIPSGARALACAPIEEAERFLVVTLLGMMVAVKSMTVEVGINND
jgi:hypothetical protein